MAKHYSDKEIAEVMLQILDTPDTQYLNSGIDGVEYIGQGCYRVELFRDDLEFAAEKDH